MISKQYKQFIKLYFSSKYYKNFLLILFLKIIKKKFGIEEVTNKLGNLGDENGLNKSIDML